MLRRVILTIAAPALLSAGSMLPAGCGSAGWARSNGSAARVSYDDFVVRPADITTVAEAPPDEPDDAERGTDSASNDPATAGGEPSPASAGANANARERPGASAPLQPGREIVIDSFVGQINGRPIYANSFFAPIDARLRALRDQMTPIQFSAAREAVIRDHLSNVLQSELFLAEAESRLTPDQQRGLLAWLTRQREDIISQRGGSAGLAAEQLQEYEGIEGGIDEVVADERKKALIQMVIAQDVRPRVRISWRDVERRYNQVQDQLNPPGTATILWIRLLPEQRDRIEEATQRLEAGEDFRTVARDMGMREDGMLTDALQISGEGLAGATGLRQEYLEKLTGLGPGETVGPFEVTSTTAQSGRLVIWLHVLEIKQPTIRSLYDADVQIILREDLLATKFRDEQRRFYLDLLDEGTFNEIEKMQARLFEIGRIRYAQ